MKGLGTEDAFTEILKLSIDIAELTGRKIKGVGTEERNRTENKDSIGISLINQDQWGDYYQKLLTEDRFLRKIFKMDRTVE